MWSILYLFQGLFYICLLVIVFKSKKRIVSEENNIFKILAIVNIISFVTEILLQISIRTLGGQDLLSFALGRVYLIEIYTWFCILSIYTYYIAKIKRLENEVLKTSKFHTAKMTLIGFIIAGAFLFLVLPIKIMHKGEIIYSYGMAVDALKIALGSGLVYWLILLIMNRKEVSQKAFAPIYVSMVLLIINDVLQTINPSILIATSTMAFTMFIMFFTIENPDLKMIAELEVARDQANKANNAKTDFLSSMSHEIRTPLNAIVGFSDCIMDAKNLEEAKENAKDIVNAGQTLLEIVNGILDISKIEAGKLEIINTKYNARETFTELAKLISTRMKDKGLDFTYYIAPDLPETLCGDHANIKKIVTNLLSNACKYTDTGFVRYEVNCVNMKDYTRLIISVEDSGRGIKKQSVDKMFTKFQRLDEDRNTTIEGTGLGLAITKQLTELMGGKVIVHTVYGEGSKFTIVINQKITTSEEKEHKVKDTLDLNNVRILIVDDAPMNLKVATKLLEKYGANCLETSESGFDCLDKINAGKQYDLILLDDMMPKMSGVITLQKLKENPAFKTPVIALTANAVTGMREKYLADGFDDYLAKPIEKPELIRVINQILGRTGTEEIDIVEEKPEEKEEIENVIIPVDDNIEEQLGKQVELRGEENYSKESTKVVENTPVLIPAEEVNQQQPVQAVAPQAQPQPQIQPVINTPQQQPVQAVAPQTQPQPQIQPVQTVVPQPVINTPQQQPVQAVAPQAQPQPQIQPVQTVATQQQVPSVESQTQPVQNTTPQPLSENKTYDVNYLKENGADLEKALELLGDMEMYNSTIQDFCSEIDEKWNNIKQYRDSHDMENYAILVHSLKSDCKYIGFYSLADIAYNHELKSKEKDLDYVLNHFNELETEYNRVIEVIKNYNSQLKG